MEGLWLANNQLSPDITPLAWEKLAPTSPSLQEEGKEESWWCEKRNGKKSTRSGNQNALRKSAVFEIRLRDSERQEAEGMMKVRIPKMGGKRRTWRN